MIVLYHKKFTKRFVKLPPKIQDAFYGKLKIFYGNKYDKRLNNHALHGDFVSARSVDVTGDYRAIFIEDANKIVFTHIGTHNQLYEK